MNFETIRLLESFLLPPGGLIFLALIGVIFSAFRFGRRLAFIAVVSLYLLSTPFISKQLLLTLEKKHPPLTPEQLMSAQPDAIVLLGGGYYGNSVEYGDTSIGPFFAERLRYTAWLAQKTNLPIIITSGNADAPAAAKILETQFGIRPVAVEKSSWTTDDNAKNVATILPQLGFAKVILVTHGWHMPRTVWSFERQNINIIAAPMGILDNSLEANRVKSWHPSIPALLRSRNAIHELAGITWYKYGPGMNKIFSTEETATSSAIQTQKPSPQMEINIPESIQENPATNSNPQ